MRSIIQLLIVVSATLLFASCDLPSQGAGRSDAEANESVRSLPALENQSYILEFKIDGFGSMTQAEQKAALSAMKRQLIDGIGASNLEIIDTFQFTPAILLRADKAVIDQLRQSELVQSLSANGMSKPFKVE